MEHHFTLDDRRKAIRKFRKQLKLSQGELAKLANIGQQMLSKFERGDRDLSPAAFLRVEEAITEALANRRAALEKADRMSKPVLLSDLLKPAKVKELISRKSPMDVRQIARQAQEEFRRKEQEDPDFRVLREVTANLLKDNQELRAQVAELRGRVDLLCDLLDVKTKEVRAAAEAQDLKAKLER
jgi:transcriptional regulator with XRE-family HTH domain